MREWGGGYKNCTSGGFVSLFNFAKVWDEKAMCWDG